MEKIKEIGGYFALDFFNYPIYHNKGIMLNSGRNALRYIIRSYNIKELVVPYYTCPVVWQAIEQENVKTIFYHINSNLEIDLPQLPENKFILVNNYFGIKGKYINKIASIYPKLIVDDAQSFFAPKIGLAHFKSPRKFLGLPDGGIVLSEKIVTEDFPIGTSWQRCSHMLLRADISADAGYNEFKKNDSSLDNLPIEKMSNLTSKMLEMFNYEYVKKQRIKNFTMLHKALKNRNLLSIDIDNEDIPMVYPFLSEDKTLRKKMIDKKIYIARYWPDIDIKCPPSSYELELQQNLLPLPIDQRYGEEDMQRILEILDV